MRDRDPPTWRAHAGAGEEPDATPRSSHRRPPAPPGWHGLRWKPAPVAGCGSSLRSRPGPEPSRRRPARRTHGRKKRCRTLRTDERLKPRPRRDRVGRDAARSRRTRAPRRPPPRNDRRRARPPPARPRSGRVLGTARATASLQGPCSSVGSERRAGPAGRQPPTRRRRRGPSMPRRRRPRRAHRAPRSS